MKIEAFILCNLTLFGLFQINEAKGGGRGKGYGGGKSSWFGGSKSSSSHTYSSPSYSSGFSHRSNNHNSYSSNYGSHHIGGSSTSFSSGNKNLGYGKIFGSVGLGSNTYISNNHYRKYLGSSGSDFLTNAMFYSAGVRHGHYQSNDYHRYWNENQDRKWRATTQGPYFANKVPSEDDKILPASAVIGAATAFGLASLLPLKVPANKPLMYCGNTELMQSQIRIENRFIYKCKNSTFEIGCPLVSKTSNNSTDIQNSTIIINENMEGNSTDKNLFLCEKRIMICDGDEEKNEEIYCKSGTLFSKEEIFCNSTSILKSTKFNKTFEILNCYKGELPETQASFIPTTTSSTQAPTVTTTTEKPLSIGAQVHIFLLKLIGQHNVLEKKKKEIKTSKVEFLWTPEALEMPPETPTQTTTTTTTLEPPFKWMMKVPSWSSGSGSGNDYDYQEPGPGVLSLHYEIEKMQRQFRLTSTTSHWGLVKVYLTTTTEKNLITTTESTTTTTTENNLNSDEIYDFILE